MTTLPPVTDDHRRRAFAAMAVRGLSYEQAMRHPTWCRVIECAASQLRNREWVQQHPPTTTHVRRYCPATGTWRTQCVPGLPTREKGLL